MRQHHARGGSDILRLRHCLTEEYEAARRGLTGLAQGTATHAFITQRMERMQQYQEEVIALVGFERGMHLVTEVLEMAAGGEMGYGIEAVQPDRDQVSHLSDDRDMDAGDVSSVSDGAHPGASSAEASGCPCEREEGEK